jgi:hypothetical protein
MFLWKSLFTESFFDTSYQVWQLSVLFYHHIVTLTEKVKRFYLSVARIIFFLFLIITLAAVSCRHQYYSHKMSHSCGQNLPPVSFRFCNVKGYFAQSFSWAFGWKIMVRFVSYHMNYWKVFRKIYTGRFIVYSRIKKIYDRKTVRHVFTKPVQMEGKTKNVLFPVSCCSSHFYR